MPIRHGDILAKRASTWPRDHFWRSATAPRPSSPTTWKRVLTDINADYGNRTLCCRSHRVLLVLAPLASLSLAGQEHGRTIPLADIVRIEIPQRSEPLT